MIQAEEPKVADTGRYNTTEACKALGIHRNTLKSYCRKGYIKCTYSRVNRRPLYSGIEIKKLWRASLFGL